MKNILFTISLLSFLTIGVYAAKPATLRLASYNIEFFKESNAGEIAGMLHAYHLDIIALQEVPGKQGYQSVQDVRNALNRIEQQQHTGREWYCYTGKIGSGNDDRKFKSILSRTPLSDTDELDLMPPGGRRGASAVRATTEISGLKVSVYSLHTPGAPHYKQTLINSPILRNDPSGVIIVMGDFNEKLYGKGDSAMRSFGFIPTWKILNIDVKKRRTYDATGKEPNEGVIDHIYLKGENIRVVDGGIIEMEKPLSDHCPIWAVLRIPSNTKQSRHSR